MDSGRTWKRSKAHSAPRFDYAMLVKIYGEDSRAKRATAPQIATERRRRRSVSVPTRKHISTSYVERQNLTMRMHMRRFTRLTNAFSKKLENHIAAISLHFMYYNFCRIHQSLRVTPAMAANVTDRVWDVEDIVKLLENKLEDLKDWREAYFTGE